MFKQRLKPGLLTADSSRDISKIVKAMADKGFEITPQDAEGALECFRVHADPDNVFLALIDYFEDAE